MSDYYGVTRSDAYLAHYGVKGMKWGVRKAVESGNAKRLDRHYRRAQRKLNNLNYYADVNEQAKLAKTQNKIAKVALGVGLGTAGISTFGKLGNMALDNRRYLDYDLSKRNIYGKMHDLGARTSSIALGIAAGSKASAANAKWRTTPKGHAKSIAKRDAWRNQMRDVFAGTKYANLPDVQKKRHRKKSN